MKLRSRLLLGASMGGLFTLLSWFGAGQHLEELSVDLRLRSRPDREASGSIRLVVVDDGDIDRLGRWPIPRAAHADVLQILAALEAKQVTFDVVFSEPSGDTEQDAAFQEVVEALDFVTLAYYFEDLVEKLPEGYEEKEHFLEGIPLGKRSHRGGFLRGLRPHPPFTPLKATFASVNARQTSDDEIVRRVPLFIRHGDSLYPALALQTVIESLDLKPDQVEIEPGSHVTLKETPTGDIRIPIDRHGQMRINFGFSESIFATSRSYLDLYSAAQDSDAANRAQEHFRSRFVFVGNISTGNSDTVVTPVGRLPGVFVQAMAAENMLTGQFLRPLPRLLDFVLLILFPAVLALLIRPANAWLTIVLLILVSGAWISLAFAAIRYDLILPLAAPLGAAGATVLLILPAQISGIVARFSGYVPKPLRTRLLANEPLPSRTRRNELTIFFSDIRGFTAWTEKTEPDEVTEILNEYLAAMADVVEEHNGTLDKFVGDCVMVFFGAPIEREDHAEASIRMAWDMQRRIALLNEKWSRQDREGIRVGMGINTDFVTVGNFGSHRFQDFTVIGRGVNLAARIESVAPGDTILLSARTKELAEGFAETRLFAEVNLKGIPHPIPIYEVLGITGAKNWTRRTEPADWTVRDQGSDLGPFPAAGLQVMLATGRIDRSAEASSLSSGESRPVESILGLDDSP